MASENVMRRRPTMVARAETYLTARRAVGLALRIEGQQLMGFARWADRESPRAALTEALALTWARASERATRVGQARRLEVIRPFARWLQAHESDSEVPLTGLLGPAHPRRVPCLLSGTEINRLLASTAKLLPPDGLRPTTMRTLFGLLACTGLRPGEAAKLTRDDVDLDAGRIRVRDTKFHKSRLVPLHPTATYALRAYTRARDRHVPQPRTDAFFLLDRERPVTLRRAQTAFASVRHRLGWDAWSDRPTPRLYDLRHRFACERLTRWHAADCDVNAHLAALATYLGHVKVTDTYWYLTGVPSLMAVCARRFERSAGRPTGGSR